MTTVFVAGALANKPGNGGEAWVRLSWVLGLRRLGLDVRFVEEISPQACVDRHGEPTDIESSANLAYYRSVVDRFDLSSSSTLVYGGGAKVFGVPEDEMLAGADSAAALFNISGHLSYQPLLRRLSPKVYVDLDPGFTQYWHAAGRLPNLAEHDLHVTVGLNVGSEGCPIPTGGMEWRPVLPPVVLQEWPLGPAGDRRRFTTVGSWRGGFGPVTWGERTFGLKLHEFRRFIDLPRRATAAFEVALDIHPADGKDKLLLDDHGWRLRDPREVAGDPDAFRRYVQGSGAEFSVAQGIYVETGSGWFSDRTVRYLASGRPAVVQDTGFSRILPTGAGLLPFSTIEEATAAVHAVTEDYEGHRHAARSLAGTHFDSDVVLSGLLQDIGVTP